MIEFLSIIIEEVMGSIPRMKETKQRKRGGGISGTEERESSKMSERGEWMNK